MCPRDVRSRYFEAVASAATHSVTSIGVSGASTNATIVPDSSALLGQASRRSSKPVAAISIRHAPAMAVSTCGATLGQPVRLPATASRTPKTTTSDPFGVRTKRRTRSNNGGFMIFSVV